MAVVSGDEVLRQAIEDPDFRAEWERTAVARAVALCVTKAHLWSNLTDEEFARSLDLTEREVADLESGVYAPLLREEPHA